jgi:Cu/Ag efflux pump CusA
LSLAGEPLSLREAIERVLIQNPMLREAELDLEAAKTEGITARERPNPELSFTVEDIALEPLHPTPSRSTTMEIGAGGFGLSVDRTREESAIQGFENSKVIVELSHTLELGKKRAKRMAAAGAKVNLKQWDLLQVKAELVRETTTVFFDLLAKQDTVQALQQDVENSLAQVEAVKQRVAEGDAAQIEEIRAIASVEGNRRIERLLLTNFPNEIAHVWSRIGAAEQLTDPMGMEVSDIFLQLTPRKFWRAVSSQDELVARIMDLIGTWPGMRVVATQPIEMRMNELTAGVRAEFVVYLLGEDLATLRELGRSIERILATTPGVSEVSVDVVSGQPALRLTPNPDALTRFGLSREAVLQWVTCFPGLEVTEVLEERRRIPVVLRLTNEPKALSKEVLEYSVPVAPGTTLRLADALTVVEDETVASINREWGRRVLRVQANVRGRDLASFADEVRHRIAENVHVPTGYSIEFGGQLEHLERAQRRLMWVVPAVLLLVFILLLFSLRDLRDTLIVYAGIPCALVGGLWSLYLREIPFSVSAAVGFIALAGIAVLNGQILVEAIRHYRAQGFSLRESVSAGAATRLRAVVATALTDALGFFPMALATGIGAEIQRPLATVVVAGVCSSTFLTLLLLPTLYVWAHAGVEGEEGKISAL